MFSCRLISGLVLGVILLTAAGRAGAEIIRVTSGTSLTQFDSANPSATSSFAITGLQAAETIEGIDMAPNSISPVPFYNLYGIGSSSRLYFIDEVVGSDMTTVVAYHAFQVGGPGTFSPALNGTSFGMDFNPLEADQIRVVSNTEQNRRVHSNTAASTLDTALSPAGNIVAVAYDRNFDHTTTAFPDNTTPTTLFGIDSAAGTLVRIGSVDGTPDSPNGGLITTIGSLNLGTDLNGAIGFDISGSGIAYASIFAGGQSRLYTIDLTTGNATNLGAIGNGTTSFVGLAADPGPYPVPEPGSLTLLAAAGLFLIRRNRD